MKPSELRALIFEMADGRCEWPGCKHRAVELAHAHSIGAGGRPSANVVENCLAACFAHARMSDGLQPGGWPAFVQAHNALWGEGWEDRFPMNRWAYERAEALIEHVKRARARIGIKEEHRE